MKAANKPIVSFLLYTYFGIIENSAGDETLKAAVSRAYLDAASHVLQLDGGNDEFRKAGANEIAESVKGYPCGTESYAEWHKKLCDALKDCCSDVTYGIAQKWVNMTMKYLWMLDFLPDGIQPEELHIPIDSYIIDALWEFDTVPLPPKGKYNRSFKYKTPSNYVLPWSQWDDYEAYIKLQSEAKNAIANRFKLPPVEWEAAAWIEVSKKRSGK